MLIQDVERQTGLDRATIRFYEKEGIIIPVRSENGYRSYCDTDVQLLLKVKLLRQLGVSLFKIKNLQQGSGDFSLILTEQIEILDRQIQDDTRAKFVCCEMQQDGVQFTTLDSQHYLNMLCTPVANVNRSFCETVHRECHPWRRYFARSLDYRMIATFLQVLLVMFLRIRPLPSNIGTLLNYMSYFLAVPIIAAMLHYFGTTPGKWVMGIRLENVNGGKLSGGEALYREGRVVWHGLGLFIPFLTHWKLYRSYKNDTEGTAQLWNEDTEIVYVRWSVPRKIIAAAIWILCLILSLLAAFDTVMPRYRSENLTMYEFVVNYNDYEKLFENDNTMILGEDGCWTKRTDTDVTIIQIGDGSHERKNFQYTFNDEGGIRSISFQDTWDDVRFMSLMPDYCRTALYTMIASRKGVNINDLQMIDECLEAEFGTPMESGGVHSGSFQIADVIFTWKAEIPEGAYWYLDGSIFRISDTSDLNNSNEQEPIAYSLEFVIMIGQE